MTKYTPQEREELAAAGKRLRLGKTQGNIANLNERAGKVHADQATAAKKKASHRRETVGECWSRIMEQHSFQHLKRREAIPAYDVTNPTRYPEATIDSKGNAALARVLERYKHVMKPQGITPREFRDWREKFMLMTPEQIAALVRVTPRTIRGWENGESRIPFSMWWVMHVTLQDPEYFLTRPGFHDYYIEYVDGEAHLCSYTWPDIRWTSADLYFKRCVLDEVFSLRADLEKERGRYQEQVAENTRLRRMLKVEGVTAELQAMHAHIQQLMQKLNTADVVPFPAGQDPMVDAAPAQKTA